MNGWFDSPIESFKEAYNGAVTKWRDALAALDEAYAQFMANRDYALSDDELASRWNELNGRVEFLQSTIENVESAITTVVNFISSIGETVGLSGRQTMQGMGVLPAIPWSLVALVTASVAGVWAVTNSLRSFNVDAVNRQIAEQNIVNAQEGKPLIPFINLDPPGGGGGFFDNLTGMTKWIVIGGLGLLAYKAFNETGNRRRLT